MNGRGQMLLSAALAVCVCLIALAALLSSIKYGDVPDKPLVGRDVLDNIIWAQDSGLKHIAATAGNYSWADKALMAEDFTSRTGSLAREIAQDMRTYGIAVTFTYNDTLASMSRSGRAVPAESIGGVLVAEKSGKAVICGCAYDLSIADGSAKYGVSRAVAWD